MKKTRGPYQHRYDLPGGSQQPGEGLTKLSREKFLKRQDILLEAILTRIYDVFVREELTNFMVHHIMAFMILR